jgi:hypothetical protein
VVIVGVLAVATVASLLKTRGEDRTPSGPLAGVAAGGDDTADDTADDGTDDATSTHDAEVVEEGPRR